MSASDNYTRFNVGDKVRFTTVRESARGSISMKSREGVVTQIQGRVLVVKSGRTQYGVFHTEARKVGEKSTLTEYVETLAGEKEAKP